MLKNPSSLDHLCSALPRPCSALNTFSKGLIWVNSLPQGDTERNYIISAALGAHGHHVDVPCMSSQKIFFFLDIFASFWSAPL